MYALKILNDARLFAKSELASEIKQSLICFGLTEIRALSVIRDAFLGHDSLRDIIAIIHEDVDWAYLNDKFYGRC
jgi:hypothetical protein